MNLADVEETADLHGGLLTIGNCPAAIPSEVFALLSSSTARIGQAFDRILRQANAHLQHTIVLTRANSFSCRVKAIGNDGFLILVPAGMPARVRVLSRLLLSYWHQESAVRLFQSPLDNVQWSRDNVPPLLQPLFLEEDSLDWWGRLQALDETIKLDPAFDPDVLELVHVALLFLLSHEFTHVLHGHFDLLKRAQNETLSLSVPELRRGIEIDADDGAAAVAMLILKQDVDEGIAAGRDVKLERGWLRLAYAVTTVFAISDTHRRFFGGYDDGAYNHPMVRCELFFDAVLRSLDGPETWRETWHQESTEGWKRAVLALENVGIDAVKAKFGHRPKGAPAAPLHTLSYSVTPFGPTNMEIARKSRAAHELMWKVREHLPIFKEAAAARAAQQDSSGGELEKMSPEHRQRAIGLYSPGPDVLAAFYSTYGSERIFVLDEPNPSPEDREDPLTYMRRIAEAKERFFDSINHLVVELTTIRSMAILMHGMLHLESSRLATLTCIAVPEMENLVKRQIDEISTRTNGLTTAQYEAAGKTLFLRDFDQVAFDKHFARALSPAAS
jgi:hypothetical protein